jgi:hypothetical protein
MSTPRIAILAILATALAACATAHENWTTCSSRTPKLEHLVAYARAYHVSLDYLVFGVL